MCTYARIPTVTMLMPKTNKPRGNNAGGEGGGVRVIKKWIKMFSANLLRSTHYLNLQPQQPLQLPPPPSSLPNAPISFFYPIFSLLCSLSLPLSVSLTVSPSFEFLWADVSARVLTASSTHNCGKGGGSGAGGKVRGFGLVLGGKEDF